MTTKRLFVLGFLTLLSLKSFSQGDDKNIRFGMNITPQLDWERSGDTKKYTRDGIAGKFGFGLSMEFKINDVVHFLTGIGANFSGGSMNYNVGDTVGYVTDKSQNLIPISTLNKDIPGYFYAPGNPYNDHVYRLINRSYKTTYVCIPVALKMMTKEIGALKYFGVFGGNIEILTKARATDQVQDYRENLSQVTLTDMNIYSDCIPVKVGLNVGAGAEYNLSGSTSLVFGLNYYRSFTTLTKSTSDYIIDGAASTGGLNPLKHSVFGDGFALTVGILF